MRIDVYTKAILTVIAIMLTMIACKPLVSPETTASAQSTPFAALQYSDGTFFDTRTGEIWHYGVYDSNEKLGIKRRLVKLGQPLMLEYSCYKKCP